MTPPRRPTSPSRYEDENGRMSNWRPIPDPTILTTQQLMREIGALKELMQVRLDAYDKAIQLLQDFTDRQPTIAEVVAKFEERFRSIETQFVKADMTTTKQMDSITTLLQANAKAGNEKIDDIKGRVTSIEGRGQAYSSGFGFIATGIGILAAIAGAIAALFFRGSH